MAHNLSNTQNWFEQVSKQSDGKKCFWILRTGSKTIYNNDEIGDMADSWDMLEGFIQGAIANGTRNFEVKFKHSKNDPSPRTWNVRAGHNGTVSSSAIAGHSAVGETMRVQNLLVDAKIEAIQARHQAELDRRDADARAKEAREQLESRIYQLETDEKSSFDKVIEKVENSPTLMGLLQPIISGIAQSAFPQVTIGAMPSGTNVPVHEGEEGADEEGADMDLVGAGLYAMHQAGIQNPDKEIYKIAMVAAAKPAMFAMLMNQVNTEFSQIENQDNG